MNWVISVFNKPDPLFLLTSHRKKKENKQKRFSFVPKAENNNNNNKNTIIETSLNFYFAFIIKITHKSPNRGFLDRCDIRFVKRKWGKKDLGRKGLKNSEE